MIKCKPVDQKTVVKGNSLKISRGGRIAHFAAVTSSLAGATLLSQERRLHQGGGMTRNVSPQYTTEIKTCMYAPQNRLETVFSAHCDARSGR